MFYHKRTFDIAFSFCALIAASPVMAIVAAAIYITDGRPIIFKQKRLGLHGEEFDIIKFRTMTNDDKVESRKPTNLGRILRKFGLDELPQFLNVLKGEMSVVGPRPRSIDIQKKVLEIYPRISRVKPGITGPSQVSSINRMPCTTAKLLGEWKYAARPPSLALDLSYIFKTFSVFYKSQQRESDPLFNRELLDLTHR